MNQANQSFEVVQNSYPEIAKKLRLFWGHAEFSELVQGALHDSHGQTPVDLPVPVIKALLTVQSWHDQHFPNFAMHPNINETANSRSAECAIL